MKVFFKFLLFFIFLFLFLGQAYSIWPWSEEISNSGWKNSLITNINCTSNVFKAGWSVIDSINISKTSFDYKIKKEIKKIQKRLYSEINIFEIIINIIFYLSASFWLYKLTKYSEHEHIAWFAWIPWLNFYLTFKISWFPFSMFIFYWLRIVIICVVCLILIFIGNTYFTCYFNASYFNLIKIVTIFSTAFIIFTMVLSPCIFYYKRVLYPICEDNYHWRKMALLIMFFPWIAFPLLWYWAKKLHIKRSLW